MKYTINTKHQEGDTCYFNAEGNIVKTRVEQIHALLRNDGTYLIFYSVPSEKKKYGKDVKEVVEECLLFKTPEEVAEKILSDFKKQTEPAQ